MKNNKLNFTFGVVKNGKQVERYESHSKRSFLNKIRTINWVNDPISVCLRVSYGMAKTNRGTIETFYNNGEYNSALDLMEAFKSFTEPRDPLRVKLGVLAKDPDTCTGGSKPRCSASVRASSTWELRRTGPTMRTCSSFFLPFMTVIVSRAAYCPGWDSE